eukprot:13063687-Alexandrium_andersonii.AAC.1
MLSKCPSGRARLRKAVKTMPPQPSPAHQLRPAWRRGGRSMRPSGWGSRPRCSRLARARSPLATASSR